MVSGSAPVPQFGLLVTGTGKHPSTLVRRIQRQSVEGRIETRAAKDWGWEKTRARKKHKQAVASAVCAAWAWTWPGPFRTTSPFFAVHPCPHRISATIITFAHVRAIAFALVFAIVLIITLRLRPLTLLPTPFAMFAPPRLLACTTGLAVVLAGPLLQSSPCSLPLLLFPCYSPC
jgi:hypothetical protein